MLELIVCIAMAKPPQAPPLLGTMQAPPMFCHEETNMRSPKPTGDGWQWDEKEGVWWRVVEETPQPVQRTFRVIRNAGVHPMSPFLMSGGIPFLSGGSCGPRG